MTIAEVQAKYPDMPTLWETPIYRTCGPNNGVCHQNKQFPHMELATSLVGSINARCNQLRDKPETIDNICEPPGDKLVIGEFSSRIAYVTRLPLNQVTTSLQVTLADPVPEGIVIGDDNVRVVRERPGVSAVEFPIPGRFVTGTNGKSVDLYYGNLADENAPIGISYKYAAPGPGDKSMGEFLAPLKYLVAGDETQVELADPNRDGIYGAHLGGAEIKPGDPMMSYLFLRVAGPIQHGGNTLTNMLAAPSVEPQMPIANFQYWDLENAVVAMWCWISGLAADGSNALAPIDYGACDVGAMPSITRQGGEATTYSSIYADILVPDCSGCHNPEAINTTFFIEDEDKTYATLLGLNGAMPTGSNGMPYITRNDPSASFLYLRVIGDPNAGRRMPLGGQLSEASIEALETWIKQGANRN